MTIADVQRVVSMPESTLVAVRQSLRAAGLDERFVARLSRIGERLDDPLRAPMRAWHARRLPEAAAVAARLFVLHDPVHRDEVERVFGDLAPLVDAGLLDETSDGFGSPAHLALAGEIFVFGDRVATGDAVPPLNGVTAVLARAAIPSSGVPTALDLGCGAGALALAFASTSRRVVATDVNARALLWTRFNARFNGIAHVEVRHGDLFDTVRGERFDRIVAQPPFLARHAGIKPSVFAHAGERGDEIALRVLAGAAMHLTAGGRAVVLADWPLFDGDLLDARARAAVGGAAVDMLIVQSPGKNLDEYCTSLAAAEHPELGTAFAAAACAQRDHFERAGLRGISQGFVVLEGTETATKTPRSTLVSVRHGLDAPITAEVIDRLWTAHALASGESRAVLDACLRLPAGTRLIDQPGVHGAPAAVIVQIPPTRPEWPFAIEPAAAVELKEIHRAPSVLEAARETAQAAGIPLERAAELLEALARDALRRGALDVVDPETTPY
jgi:SAM-dependent methyltransferase